MIQSKLEVALAWQLEAVNIKNFMAEYRFHEDRRWRFDFAWPDPHILLAVEVEGGTWSNGRHTRGKGFELDCEKYNEAALNGWTILRVVGRHIENGMALNWIETYLTSREEYAHDEDICPIFDKYN